MNKSQTTKKKKNIIKKKNIRNMGVTELKHKMVLKTLNEKLGKGEKATMTEAMIENGYSKSYAESGQIRKKKTWQQLMNEYLPDELVAKTHQELLVAKELSYFVFPKNMKDEEIEKRMEEAGIKLVVVRESDKGKMAFYSRADTRARKDGVDLAYKVKGKMAPEEFRLEDNRLQNMSTAELEALIAKKKAFFNKED